MRLVDCEAFEVRTGEGRRDVFLWRVGTPIKYPVSLATHTYEAGKGFVSVTMFNAAVRNLPWLHFQ